MLQTVCMSPELLVNQNMGENETCGYSAGQGSPLPGETASPKSCFQQSPSLPDSGLTELSVASPRTCPPPSCNPREVPAPADSELSSDPPQKRYMGVRVKMPVRELLRKIRLSQGLEPAHSEEASAVKMVTKGSSGKTAEKRRAHPYTEKQLRQSKQSVGQALKGLEDLDILVEVLQEDLNKSQLKEESWSAVPAGFGQGFSRDLQSSWWEPAGSKERQHSPPRLPPGCCFRELTPAPREGAENSYGDQRNVQESSSPGVSSRTGDKGSSWWMQGAHMGSQKDKESSWWMWEAHMGSQKDKGGSWWMQGAHMGPQKDFTRSSSQNTSAPFSSSEMLLGAHTGSAGTEGLLKLAPASFTQQDLSALSFFQFQLHREESLLSNIPMDKLLAPDENGNRLLHKAVAQGRRALTYALAQRFASLNKINEKDAEERTALHLAAEKNQHLMVSDLISLGANVNEQDSCGKTPLHLCAENGYLRVLEVLKHCKTNGVCVEVDLPDHYGLTPLHCAALAHTALVTESQSTAPDTDVGRFLRLRQEQILEGIHCLLQMGGQPELQALNSCQTTTTWLKIEENTELMCLLRSHKPQGQDVLQETHSLLDAPRGIPSPLPPEDFPELCSTPASDLLDVILTGKCC